MWYYDITITLIFCYSYYCWYIWIIMHSLSLPPPFIFLLLLYPSPPKHNDHENLNATWHKCNIMTISHPLPSLLLSACVMTWNFSTVFSFLPLPLAFSWRIRTYVSILLYQLMKFLYFYSAFYLHYLLCLDQELMMLRSANDIISLQIKVACLIS